MDFEAEVTQLQQENEELLARIKDLEHGKRTLEEENEALQEQMVGTPRRSIAMAKLAKANKGFASSMGVRALLSVKNQMSQDQLTAQLEDAEEQIYEYQQQLDKAAKDTKAAKEECARLQAKLTEVEKKFADHTLEKNLRERVNGLEQRNRALTSQVEDLKDQLDEAKTSFDPTTAVQKVGTADLRSELRKKEEGNDWEFMGEDSEDEGRRRHSIAYSALKGHRAVELLEEVDELSMELLKVQEASREAAELAEANRERAEQAEQLVARLQKELEAYKETGDRPSVAMDLTKDNLEQQVLNLKSVVEKTTLDAKMWQERAQAAEHRATSLRQGVEGETGAPATEDQQQQQVEIGRLRQQCEVLQAEVETLRQAESGHHDVAQHTGEVLILQAENVRLRQFCEGQLAVAAAKQNMYEEELQHVRHEYEALQGEVANLVVGQKGRLASGIPLPETQELPILRSEVAKLVEFCEGQVATAATKQRKQEEFLQCARQECAVLQAEVASILSGHEGSKVVAPNEALVEELQNTKEECQSLKNELEAIQISLQGKTAAEIEAENAKLWRKIAHLQWEIVEWKSILQKFEEKKRKESTSKGWGWFCCQSRDAPATNTTLPAAPVSPDTSLRGFDGPAAVQPSPSSGSPSSPGA